MYVAPNDRLARKAREARKALHDAAIAQQKADNAAKINSMAKAAGAVVIGGDK